MPRSGPSGRRTYAARRPPDNGVVVAASSPIPSTTGRPRRVRWMTRRALAIAERNFGPNHHVTAEYVNNLGIVELDEGNYEAARARCGVRSALQRRGTANRTSSWPGTLNRLARADADSGTTPARQPGAVPRDRDLDAGRRAQSSLRRAGVDRAGDGLYRGGAAGTGVAPAAAGTGDSRRTSGRDHRDVARTLADLAATLVRWPANRLAPRAWPLRALGIWGRLDTPDAPEFATVLALYARLQASRGDVPPPASTTARAGDSRQGVRHRTSALRRDADGLAPHRPPSATAMRALTTATRGRDIGARPSAPDAAFAARTPGSPVRGGTAAEGWT